MIDPNLVDTVVFLMMENRSFDHMLGHLSLSGAMPDVDGLKAPLDQELYANPYKGRVYYPFEMRDKDDLQSDVPHNRHHVPKQLAYDPATGRYLMNGFARGYFEYEKAVPVDNPYTMGFLPAQDVPITTFFAENYRVCDCWFSSLPTGTPPNKLMSLAGRSRVEDVENRVLPSDNLVIDWLTRRGVRWRVYHDGFPFFGMLGRLDVMFDRNLFRSFDSLADDVLDESEATFPQVILVEPAYAAGPFLAGRPRNDDHAPAKVSFGQDLQRRLYEALIANEERWSKTVLIITYDEHGGFYDHVAPPEIGYAPPDGEYPPYTTMGLRVPGLVVSPLVSKGVPYHDLLCHTSFLQLIAERFAPGKGGYSPEVNERAERGIRSLSDVLDLDAPRSDIPHAPPFKLDPAGLLTRLMPEDPIEMMFHFAARKLVAVSPPEAGDALPELWDWNELIEARDDEPAEAGDPGVQLEGFGELMRENGGKPLGELPRDVLSAKLHKVLDFPIKVVEETEAIDSFVVSARAGVTMEVAAFNDATDEDVDGILAATATEDLGELLPPQVRLTDDYAWLKSALSAEIGVGGGGSLGQLGFSIDAERGLRLLDYRRHARDNIAVGTILSDLSRPRIALRAADVSSIRAGEALAMQVVGTVQASVEVTLADVFATQFGNIGAIFGASEAIPLKFSAGLTLSATVAVSDDFVLVFSRVDRSRIRVAVRKARQRRANLGLDATVRVEFADPAQVETALRAVIEGVVGAPYGELRDALASATGLLNSREMKLLTLAMKALGMDPATLQGLTDVRSVLEEVNQRLDTIEAQLDRTIRTIAQQKVAIGFRYEYDRISTRASLVQAILSEEALRVHHARLIRGDVTGLWAAIRGQQPGIELESYLRRRRLDTTKSWGFTLGFGPWSVYGRDRDQVTLVVDENEAGRKRIAYNGVRSYVGSWIGQSCEWSIDLRADMPRFSVEAEPRMSELDLGLALTWERRERLTEDAIFKLLDAGAVWGVSAASGDDELVERLSADLGEDCDITVQMRIDDATLRALLPELGGAKLTAFANAYGAAMPWMKEYRARREIDRRCSQYAGLWKSYFENTDMDPDQLSAMAVDHFKRQEPPDNQLRVVELRFSERESASLAGLAKRNSKMTEHIVLFNAGMAKLAEAVAQDRPAEGVLADVFRDIKELGKNSHNVRALGAYLAEKVAGLAGDARISRSVTVATPDTVHVIVPRDPRPRPATLPQQ